MQRIFTAEKITPTAVVVASIAVVGLLLAVALHAVLTRFQIVTEADGHAYRLDRLTGKLQIVTGQFGLPVEFTTLEELNPTSVPTPPPAVAAIPTPAPQPKLNDSAQLQLPPMSFAELVRSSEYTSLTPEKKKQAPQRYVNVFGKASAYATAKKYFLPPELFARLIELDSQWKADAISHIHEHDPDRIIFEKAKYLRSLTDQFDGSLRHALAAYHAGPDRIVQAVNNKGNKWEYGLPIETRQFFEAVVPSTK